MNRKIVFLVLAAVFAVAAFSAAASDDSDAATTDYNRYYYDQLDDLGKKTYDALLDQITDSNLVATIEDYDLSSYGEDLNSAFQAAATQSMNPAMNLIYYDQPYFYPFAPITECYSGNGSLESCDITITMQLDPVFVEATGGTVSAAQAAAAVKAELNAVVIDDTSIYTVAQSYHDYIANLITYPDTYGSDSYIRSIYKAVCGDHYAVCEGYAKTFKACCDIAGIPCILVSGPAGLDEKESHMWCEAMMPDGSWYLVDCTWDDQKSEVYHTYFFAGSTTEGFKNESGDAVLVSESHTSAMSELYGVTVTAPAIAELSFVDNNYYGTIGTNLGWTLNVGTGTLTVSGTGAMAATAKADYGFHAYRDLVTKVIVADGVTSVADCCFVELPNLGSVDISWDTATVSDGAFDIYFFDVTGTDYVEYSDLHGESFALNADEKMAMNDRTMYGYFYAAGELYTTVEYSHTKALVYPEIPAKEGYEGSWGAPSYQADGVSYNAVYTITQVDYEFTVDSATYQSGTVDWGTQLAKPDDPEKEGGTEYLYIFKGWQVSGTYVEFPYTLKADTTFVAVFDAIPYCTATFMNGTEVFLETPILSGGDVAAPASNPTKEGTVEAEYVFAGWSVGGVKAVFPYTVTADTTFDAEFTEVPYCDYEFLVDTEVYDSGTILAGELIPAPSGTPTKTASANYEYVFERWDGYIPTQPIADDVSFPAVFTEYFTGITVSKTMTVTVGAEQMLLKPATAQSIIDQAKADSATTLTVTLTHGTVKLDAAALAAMDADDFEIGILTYTAKDFDSETAKLIGDATVYSVWAGTSLGTGSITITVPYDTTGKDTSVLKACYIVSAKIKETYDVTFSDGNATFTVPHLSNYAILDTSTPEPTPEGGSTGLPISNEMLIGIVIVLIVIVAAVVIIRRR